MDYAFEFEQVVSIISAPFTVNEQFCLGELLLCSIRQKKKKTLIFWLWVFAGMKMWLLSGGGSSLPAWRSSLQRIHVVASLPLFSLSFRFPLLPLVLLNGILPQLLIRHFFFLFTSSTPSFSLYAPSSVCLISALYTLYTWFLYQSFYLFHLLLFHLLSLSLLLFCFCWCVSLSARPCHSCMRERTPGARRVEWSNFPGEPDRCVRLLETFKEFQFPRADCSMNYSLATFGSLAPHSWYSLVYIFLYYSSINYIFHWNFECDRQGEISPELAGKWARRERLLFFFTVPPLICR